MEINKKPSLKRWRCTFENKTIFSCFSEKYTLLFPIIFFLSSCHQAVHSSAVSLTKVDLHSAFVVFFITLGPLKTIPVFARISKKLSTKNKTRLAIRGAMVATILVAVIAVVICFLAFNWDISPESLMLAAGILLFVSAGRLVLNFKIEAEENEALATDKLTEEDEKKRIKITPISPVAVPAIITPIGVLAILYFVSLSIHSGQIWEIVIILTAIMLSNLVCMIYAHTIVAFVGGVVFQIIGWLFAILQSALAVQFMYDAVHIMTSNSG